MQAGATNSILSIHSAGTDTSGFYYAVITNAFGTATSEVARVVVASTNQHVTVFDHPEFVRTLGGATNESDAIQASVRYFGYTVDTVTNFTSLPNTVVLLPSLANGDLALALSPAEAAALSNHVAAGGALILHGDAPYHEAGLLHRLFGWQLVQWKAESGVYSYRESLHRRTFFRYCDASIISQATSYGFETGTLPPGSLVAYLDDNDRAMVAEMRWGRGKVIHLGWNWRNAVPLGASDGGWVTLLGAALAEAGSPEPRPHLRLTSVDSPMELILSATPHSTAELLTSDDLNTWTPVSTNIIPASGVLHLPLSGASPSSHRFFRALEQ
jgi:hypothetical protein